jgi:GTP-binding protein EngB required for normal cell division
MAIEVVYVSLVALALTIIGHAVKVGSDRGKDQQRIKTLEDWREEEKAKTEDMLTITSHNRMQDVCRGEIYKDMSRLEDNVNKVLNKIDKLEEKRDRKEIDQQKKIEEMYRIIVKIDSYVNKDSINNNIGVF